MIARFFKILTNTVIVLVILLGVNKETVVQYIEKLPLQRVDIFKAGPCCNSVA